MNNQQPLPSSDSFLADLSPELARSAYDGVSFNPERRGETTRREYAEGLAGDFARLARHADTPEKRAELETEFARYRAGFRQRWQRYLYSSARCVSWFIAGPSNFPARRMQKRADVAHKRLNELFEFRKRALAALAKKLCPSEGGPIMAGDADAVDRLAEKIAQAENLQERMRDANATIRRFKKDGPERQVQALQAIGFPALQAAKLLQPDFCGRIGFPDYALTNNSANIRRMRARLEEISRAKATPAASVKCVNATLEDDPPANRVRLFFPGKPAAEIREKLKRRGFRWAPTVGAWQAYRNSETLPLAREIAGEPIADAPGAPAIATEAENPTAAAAVSDYRPFFNENDCSGVYDGVSTVVSDADPGL